MSHPKRTPGTAAGFAWSDAASVLAHLARATGHHFEYRGASEDGESGGALYVEWRDGRPAVITRSFAPTRELLRTAEVLDLARGRGLPVPRHHLVVELPDRTTAVVQERLPGAPARQVDLAFLDAALDLNERFADVLRDRRDVPVPPLNLRGDGPVFPQFGPGDGLWHETLRGYSDHSRHVLALVQSVGERDRREMYGDDLVHCDFTRENILFGTEGGISGIVDWNWGAARGDRRFGLVKLRFELTWATLDPQMSPAHAAVLRRLDEVFDEIDPAWLSLYWGHWTLHQVSWAIANGFDPSVISAFLHLGESRLR